LETRWGNRSEESGTFSCKTKAKAYQTAEKGGRWGVKPGIVEKKKKQRNLRNSCKVGAANIKNNDTENNRTPEREKKASFLAGTREGEKKRNLKKKREKACHSVKKSPVRAGGKDNRKAMGC